MNKKASYKQVNRISEFIIDLICLAKENDIKEFLNYIFPYEQIGLYATPKIELISNLFLYIDSYIDVHLKEREELFRLKRGYLKGDDEFKPSIPCQVYDPQIELCLHLYALCENFYSYILVTSKNKDDVKLLNFIYKNNHKKNEQIELSASKDNSPAKLLNILINSFVENGFYYCFFNDLLLKIEIKNKIETKINPKMNKDYYDRTKTFVFTKYKLIDKGKQTFIVNNKIGINESLGILLVRNKYVFTNELEYFIEQGSKSIGFTQANKIHDKIVKILKIKKYKGVPCTEGNMARLKSKCNELLEKMAKLQQKIDPNTENDYISVFPTYDFEKEIFEIKSNENFPDMREFRKNRRNKLIYYIKQLEHEIEIEDDEYIYGPLMKPIAEIKSLIEKSLK